MKVFTSSATGASAITTLPQPPSGRVMGVFTGSSTATWTLPALAGNTGLELWIKNRGSATLTISRAGSDNLYDTTSQTTVSVTAGSSMVIVNDGSFWLVTVT